MLHLTTIDEGACYVTDNTRLYVAWSMLRYSSKLFWGSGIIKDLDRAVSLMNEGSEGNVKAWSEFVELLQNIESFVLVSTRIMICFENYFKARILLSGYVIHEMNRQYCDKYHPQFMKKKGELLQKTKPILLANIKEAEGHGQWSFQPLKSLSKETIMMHTLLKKQAYKAIYSKETKIDRTLFSVLDRLNKTRNTLHFLSIEFVPSQIKGFIFLRDYVSNEIDTLSNKISEENKGELDIGKAEIDHLSDIDHENRDGGWV